MVGIHTSELSPQSIYRLKKACRVDLQEEQGQLLTPEEVVDRIFLLVDENGDGKRGRAGEVGRAAHSPAPPLSSHVSSGPPPPPNDWYPRE